ncbi:MAG: ABC-type transport auxiliary lipoprotein family protein [Dokdonella sp.]
MMRPLLVASLALTLGACSAITGKREPFAIYSPQLHFAAPAADVTVVPWQLLIDVPMASNALANSRLVVMPSPGVLEVFPAARWRDPAPQMLRSLMIEAFDRSGRIVGVSGTSSGVGADFILTTELRDFQIDYVEGKPHARVRLVGKLVDRSNNRIVAAQLFDAQSTASSADVAAAANAFEQALDTLLPELVDWTLQQGSAHWRVPEPAPKSERKSISNVLPLAR